MSLSSRRWLVAALFALAVAWTPLAHAAGGYNATGQCLRPQNTTSYGSGAITKLFGCQSAPSGGSLVPMTITVGGAMPGANFITGARLYTNGTGASGATYKVYLFSAAPTISGLSDQSTYVGPYAADLTGGTFVGTLTCSAMTPTNDGTPTYWSECSIGNLVSNALQFIGSGPTVTLDGMIEVTNGYTPISNEQITVQMSTVPAQ